VDANLKIATSAIEAATGRLTVEQIGRRIPGKWSVAEILEHVTLGAMLTVEALEKALASGDTKARRPTLFQRLARVLVLDLGYFPRADAPANVTPRGSFAPEQSRGAALAAMAAVDSALARAADRFGEGTPLLKHPYFAALTVPQWRKFFWRHTVHHMRQVRRRTREGASSV
jgi:hypothetical protein